MSDVYQVLADAGIDKERLEKVLKPQGDRWGELVHAFEVLTVLSAVRDTWPEKGSREQVIAEVASAMEAAADLEDVGEYGYGGEVFSHNVVTNLVRACRDCRQKDLGKTTSFPRPDGV